MAEAPANRDQSALWNEGSGRTWVELQELLDDILAPLSAPVSTGVV